MKKRSPMAAVTLLGIALAGCGGSSGPSLSNFKSDFKTDKVSLKQLGSELQTTITGASSKTDAELATALAALSTKSDQEASKLAKLDPPAKFKSDLSKLVAGLNGVGTDLKTMADAATKHDAAAARAATKTLLTDAAKVQASDNGLTSGLGLPKS